jgi:hypothetical protein
MLDFNLIADLLEVDDSPCADCECAPLIVYDYLLKLLDSVLSFLHIPDITSIVKV